MGELEQPVGEPCSSVVDVGDDAEVADVTQSRIVKSSTGTRAAPGPDRNAFRQRGIVA